MEENKNVQNAFELKDAIFEVPEISIENTANLLSDSDPKPDPKPKGSLFSSYIQKMQGEKDIPSAIKIYAKAFKGDVEFDKDAIYKMTGGDAKAMANAEALYKALLTEKLNERDNVIAANPYSINKDLSTKRQTPVVNVSKNVGFDAAKQESLIEYSPDVIAANKYLITNEYINKNGEYTKGDIWEEHNPAGFFDKLAEQFTTQISKSEGMAKRLQNAYGKTVAEFATNKDYYQAEAKRNPKLQKSIEDVGGLDNFLEYIGANPNDTYYDENGVPSYAIKSLMDARGEGVLGNNMPVIGRNFAKYDKSLGQSFLQGTSQGVQNVLNIPLAPVYASESLLAEQDKMYEEFARQSNISSKASKVQAFNQKTSEEGLFGSFSGFVENAVPTITEMGAIALATGGIGLGVRGGAALMSLARMQGGRMAVNAFGRAGLGKGSQVIASEAFTMLGFNAGIEQARDAGLYGAEALELGVLYGAVTHYSQKAFGNPVISRMFGGEEKTMLQKAILKSIDDIGKAYIPALKKATTISEKKAIQETMRRNAFQKVGKIWDNFAKNKSVYLDPVKEATQEMTEGLLHTMSAKLVNQQAELRGLSGRVEDSFSFNGTLEEGALSFLISGMFNVGRWGTKKAFNRGNKLNETPYQTYIANAIARGDLESVVEEINQLRDEGLLGSKNLDILGNVIEKGKAKAMSENDYIAIKAIEEANRINRIYQNVKQRDLSIPIAGKMRKLSELSVGEETAVINTLYKKVQDKVAADITNNVVQSQELILDIARKQADNRGKLLGLRAPSVEEGGKETKKISLEDGTVVDYDPTKHLYLDEVVYEGSFSKEDLSYFDLLSQIEDAELMQDNKEEAYIEEEELDARISEREEQIKEKYRSQYAERVGNAPQEIKDGAKGDDWLSTAKLIGYVKDIQEQENKELSELRKRKGVFVKEEGIQQRKGFMKAFRDLFGKLPFLNDPVDAPKGKKIFRTKLVDLEYLGISPKKNIRNIHLIDNIEERKQVLEDIKKEYEGLTKERKELLDDYYLLDKLNDTSLKRVESTINRYVDEFIKEIYGISVENLKSSNEEINNFFDAYKDFKSKENIANAQINEYNNSIDNDIQGLIQEANQLVGENLFSESDIENGIEIFTMDLSESVENPASIIQKYPNAFAKKQEENEFTEIEAFSVYIKAGTISSMQTELSDLKNDPSMEIVLNRYMNALAGINALKGFAIANAQISENKALQSIVGRDELLEYQKTLSKSEKLFEQLPGYEQLVNEIIAIASQRENARVQEDIKKDLHYNTTVAGFLVRGKDDLNQEYANIISSNESDEAKNNKLIELIYQAEAKVNNASGIAQGLKESRPKGNVDTGSFGSFKESREPEAEYDDYNVFNHLSALKRKDFYHHLNAVIEDSFIIPSLEQQRTVYHIVSSMLLGNDLTYLIGEGGTGKSTVVNLAIQVYQSILSQQGEGKISVYATSFNPNIIADMQARKAKEKSGIIASESYTIGGIDIEAINNADVIILDEFTIYKDEAQLKAFKEAVKGKKVIMVGDLAQITPDVVNYGTDFDARIGLKSYVAPTMKASFRTNILPLQQFQKDVRRAVFSPTLSIQEALNDQNQINPANISYEQIEGNKNGIYVHKSRKELIEDFKNDSREKVLLVYTNAQKDALVKELNNPSLQVLTTREAQGKEFEAVYYITSFENDSYNKKGGMRDFYVASTRPKSFFAYNGEQTSVKQDNLTKLKPLAESLPNLQRAYRARIAVGVDEQRVRELKEVKKGAVSSGQEQVKAVVEEPQEKALPPVEKTALDKEEENTERVNVENLIVSSLSQKLKQDDALREGNSIEVVASNGILRLLIAGQDGNKTEISNYNIDLIGENSVEDFTDNVARDIKEEFDRFREKKEGVNPNFKEEIQKEQKPITEENFEDLVLQEKVAIIPNPQEVLPDLEPTLISNNKVFEEELSNKELAIKVANNRDTDVEGRIASLRESIKEIREEMISLDIKGFGELVLDKDFDEAFKSQIPDEKRQELGRLLLQYYALRDFRESKEQEIFNALVNDIYRKGGTNLYLFGVEKPEGNVILKVENFSFEGEREEKTITIYKDNAMIGILRTPKNIPQNAKSYNNVMALMANIESFGADGVSKDLGDLEYRASKRNRNIDSPAISFNEAREHLKQKGYFVAESPIVYTEKRENKEIVKRLSLAGKSLASGKLYMLYGVNKEVVNQALLGDESTIYELYSEGKIGFQMITQGGAISLNQDFRAFTELLFDKDISLKQRFFNEKGEYMPRNTINSISKDKTGEALLTLRMTFSAFRAGESYGIADTLISMAKAFTNEGNLSSLPPSLVNDASFMSVARKLSSNSFRSYLSNFISYQKNADNNAEKTFGHLLLPEIHDFLLRLHLASDIELKNEKMQAIVESLNNKLQGYQYNAPIPFAKSTGKRTIVEIAVPSSKNGFLNMRSNNYDIISPFARIEPENLLALLEGTEKTSNFMQEQKDPEDSLVIRESEKQESCGIGNSDAATVQNVNKVDPNKIDDIDI